MYNTVNQIHNIWPVQKHPSTKIFAYTYKCHLHCVCAFLFELLTHHRLAINFSRCSSCRLAFMMAVLPRDPDTGALVRDIFNCNMFK
jgi:hypothetical protein